MPYPALAPRALCRVKLALQADTEPVLSERDEAALEAGPDGLPDGHGPCARPCVVQLGGDDADARAQGRGGMCAAWGAEEGQGGRGGALGVRLRVVSGED
ncbi:hypothetical protein EVG20_g11344 [Dentipellis fragilis]|uniref:Uncharacterized protein n=1 Tax=Dentipellis fragilis TaxID=205917 RepID=A0A4Y9XN20_9AGAM|nr:hypothetical protein EVG20_g11344 [Dentipellis fragilis]